MIKFFKLYFLDILNYIYFRKVVSKFNSTDTWKRLNLRQNQIGEIYTVVRLRDEDMGDPDEIMTTRLMEIAKDKNIFIADMDIQFSVGGLVVVDYYHIQEDPNAFLVIWQPKLQAMSFVNSLKFFIPIITLISIVYFLFKYIVNYFL
jgi:hypothetical protein